MSDKVKRKVHTFRATLHSEDKCKQRCSNLPLFYLVYASSAILISAFWFRLKNEPWNQCFTQVTNPLSTQNLMYRNFAASKYLITDIIYLTLVEWLIGHIKLTTQLHQRWMRVIWKPKTLWTEYTLLTATCQNCFNTVNTTRRESMVMCSMGNRKKCIENQTCIKSQSAISDTSQYTDHYIWWLTKWKQGRMHYPTTLRWLE